MLCSLTSCFECDLPGYGIEIVISFLKLHYSVYFGYEFSEISNVYYSIFNIPDKFPAKYL
jgi:hypothetical protein